MKVLAMLCLLQLHDPATATATEAELTSRAPRTENLDICPEGYYECGQRDCCSSDYGAWASMALSFLGVMLLLLCCSCWHSLRSGRTPTSRGTRQRLRRASSTGSGDRSGTPPRSLPWEGEPPPVFPGEPPPLYAIAVISGTQQSTPTLAQS